MRAISGVVTIGMVLGGMAALAGCAGDEPAEYQEQCAKYINNELVRVDDSECGGGGGGHWVYSRGFTPGAVGSKINPAHVTTVRPAGASIARPPASGGFGGFKGGTGS